MKKILIFAVLIIGSWPNLTWAAAMTMAPGKIEVEVKPGESITRSIKVTNSGSELAEYEVSIASLPEEKESQFNLSRYLSVDDKTFALAPGASKNLNFRIALPLNIPIQSYHGALFVQTKAQSGVANGFIRVGSLIFVRVNGVRQEFGQLTKFRILGGPFINENSDLITALSFRNQGNTYLNPYGIITVNNWRGKELGYAKINPWYILPNQSKIHELKLKNPGIGVYQLRLTLNRGYNNLLEERSVYFIIWSWKMAVIIGVLIFILGSVLIRRWAKRKMRVI